MTKWKDPKKMQDDDLERKRKKIVTNSSDEFFGPKNEPKRFKKIKEEEFPKSHRTKG